MMVDYSKLPFGPTSNPKKEERMPPTRPEKLIELTDRERERLKEVARHVIDTLEYDKYIIPDRWNEDIKKLARVTGWCSERV